MPQRCHTHQACDDINECEMGTDTCGKDAACLNTPGSFSCTGKASAA
jgi:hypothetical protein